jgi:nucleoside phosphorylase
MMSSLQNSTTTHPQPRRTHNDYQIGIVCALSVEKAAVEEMLDAIHPRLRITGDKNEYTFGRVGVHNVVVSCLPAGVMGISPAAVVAKDMQRSFPIKFGLMVGVGGGVWSKTVDIHLGDIVVGLPEGQYSGVVQWDSGKTGEGGEFHRTGSLNKPPRILLNAVQTLKMKHWKEESKVQKYLSEMCMKKPWLSETFGYQGAEHDKLFEAKYEHKGDGMCDQCDSNRIVERRPARISIAPKIHYGTIASGGQVIKHGVTRDKIAESLGAICFEMEAAGLMDDFPCLVIRGICDYADSHKNKRWQPYAAATAAAFAKELLGVVEELADLATNTEMDSFAGLNVDWNNCRYSRARYCCRGKHRY